MMDSLETEQKSFCCSWCKRIKEEYVAYFSTGYYKYKDLTVKIDIIQDLVSTE